jgi:hypothetical protein
VKVLARRALLDTEHTFEYDRLYLLPEAHCEVRVSQQQAFGVAHHIHEPAHTDPPIPAAPSRYEPPRAFAGNHDRRQSSQTHDDDWPELADAGDNHDADHADPDDWPVEDDDPFLREADDGLVARMDELNARIGATQRELLATIAEADHREGWYDAGARDMAHFLAIRYGLSWWKASRWVQAAHALARLPRVGAALSSGELSIDTVVELCRYATPEIEARLCAWAARVSPGEVRHEADLAARRLLEEVREAHRARSLRWWWEDDRFGLHADLPPDQGAVVAAAIERAAESVPPMPDEDGPFDADARRADALVALCSSRIAADPDPDRATVVVHVRADGPGGIHGPGEPASPAGSSPPRRIACEIEGGPVIHPETAARLSCTARVQAIAEDASGQPVFVGRMQRTPPAWMMRQLRYRDRECTFPGCGARRHTHAHHLVFWEDGGETDPFEPRARLSVSPQARA